MEGNDWLLLILAIVVIAAIAAALALAARQRKSKQAEQQAEQADSMRHEAGKRSTVVRQQESKAAEVDAHARAAQAEAEAKAAEAERLRETAKRQNAKASSQRASVNEELRTADEVDPRSGTAGKAAPTKRRPPDRTSSRETSHTDDKFPDKNQR